MKSIPFCVLLIVVVADVAQAQTYKDLQLRLGAYSASTDGGERPVGVWFSTGPVVIGKTVTSTFSVGETCEAFTVSSAGSLRSNATAAWRIDVTPTRVVRDAVTFRLRLQMATAVFRDRYSLEFTEHAPAGREDLELTLRPGESWPVYALHDISRYSCDTSSSIRVSVDHYPWEEDEHRLVVADLWLVERLPNGTEAPRSQPLSVRGLPNRPFRFYFDRIVDGTVSLDIYGLLSAQLDSGAMAVAVETRCRWESPKDPRNISGPQRSVTSNVQVTPEETVEIRLPMLGEDAGPFARRALSIRIRARQLR
jgi:hypothetical protein